MDECLFDAVRHTDIVDGWIEEPAVGLWGGHADCG
jgi:hypothetical protein